MILSCATYKKVVNSAGLGNILLPCSTLGSCAAWLSSRPRQLIWAAQNLGSWTGQVVWAVKLGNQNWVAGLGSTLGSWPGQVVLAVRLEAGQLFWAAGLGNSC